MKIVEKLREKQADLNGAAPVTIAFLGDSVTQGCFEVYKTGKDSIETVFDPASSYPTRLRELLGLLYPSVQVNIVNSGISGDNAQNGSKRLERDILPYHPDLVVVSYGLNDATFGLEQISAYREALADIFARLTAAGIEVIFLTENRMCSKISPHITDPMLLRLAEEFCTVQESGVLSAYFDAARETAGQFGVRVCDCYEKWEWLAGAGVDTTELLANKLNHPTREMIYLFASSLLETILE